MLGKGSLCNRERVFWEDLQRDFSSSEKRPGKKLAKRGDSLTQQQQVIYKAFDTKHIVAQDLTKV